MPVLPLFEGWKIGPQYRYAKVWHFLTEKNGKQGRIIGHFTIRPDKGVPKHKRYELIADALAKHFKIIIPPYASGNRHSY